MRLINQLLIQRTEMLEGKLRLAIGAIAFMAAGVVCGVAGTRFIGGTPSATEVASHEEDIWENAPDADRALRDYLGLTPDQPLVQKPGSQVDFWVSHYFDYQGGVYNVQFLSVKTLDAAGVAETCNICAPDLAAVTYKKRGDVWEIANLDRSIAAVGRYGNPPDHLKILRFSLGETPAIAARISGMGQGYSVTSAYLLAYRDGWKHVGDVQMGADNAGTHQCADRGHCYYWSGRLQPLDAESNGFSDFQITRAGTEDVEGKLQPTEEVVYQYVEGKYQQKGQKPQPSIASAPSAADPPKTPAPSGGSVTPSTSGRQWYSANVNSTTCNPSQSPADRIRMIQEIGKHPKTNDLPYGVVEVIEQASAYTETVWTYYPDRSACIAALPSSQAIPSRYR